MSAERREEMLRRRRPRLHTNRICSLKSKTTISLPRNQLWGVVAVLLSCLTLQTTNAVSLLNGRYETTTDVSDYLNIALDVARMSESTDFDTTMRIYTTGAPRDSPAITLQSLSLTAETQMNNNPFYHMFRYAFWDLGFNREGEDDGLFDGAPVETYADTVVQDLFALHIPEIESDAALVMNVWMASVNGVFEAMAACKNHNTQDGLAALDKAVALWIGAGQEEGSNEKGHLLYNMAENAGERFDQDAGESRVNQEVIDAFKEMQQSLQSGACESSSTFNVRYAALRTTVYWLTGIMTVPLVQNLIHHTINVQNEGGSDMVELYALGMLPRVATCDPRVYQSLLKLDVLNDLGPKGADQAIKTIQSAYSCLGLTCRDVGSYMGGILPECQDPTSDSPFTKGGYKATSKSARSMANIDRDILQIDVFMKYNANNLALDWYTYGWNSDLSLHTLANFEFVPQLPNAKNAYSSLYENYFGRPDFLHETITNILMGKDDVFRDGSASSEQLRSAVTGILQYVVVFINIADSLTYAAMQCLNNSLESAKSFVDASAMFYIGSMADSTLNSKRFHDGKTLFVMSHDLCTDFGTCVKSGENAGASIANELVVTSLMRVIENINSSNCDEVVSLIDATILPAVSVSLVQGVLWQAMYNENLQVGSTDGGLATGDVIARGILPLVNRVSPESSHVIEKQMSYQLTSQPVPGGFKSVADAFRGDTLSDMNIGCSLVGILSAEETSGNLCGNSATAQQSKTPTKLGFGRYTFSDPAAASEHAAFALDVRDMFNAGTTEDGKSIYVGGANAKTSNVFGETVDWTPSLSSLSTLAGRVMSDDPMFNIYKYALYEDSDFEDSSDETFSFADDIVIEALSKGEDPKLAAEATVILQVFMAITNKLYSAIRLCDQRISPDREIDAAVALWLGENQGEGKFDDGWMMYSIAQSVEKFFGFGEGESPVNSILMNLFVQAQAAGKKCSKTADAPKTIRFLSHEIIRLLTQPMIQSLLFHMGKNSKNMVELYAVAALPQCAACDPQAFKSLQAAFFTGYNQRTSLTEEVLDDFAIFLRCQRITCENIETGSEADERLTLLVQKLCDRLGEDPNRNLPVAGYVPKFSVNEEARLDLDALEMYIMMRTRAYGAAEDIYRYGHNSGASNGATLALLANSTDNERVSADRMIVQAIQKDRQYAKASRGQLAEIVRRSLQSIVSHSAVLTKMRSSVASCVSGSLDAAKQDWDTAVAYYVGSIEGILAGSKSHRHGVLMYALGNEFCADFGTCETSGEATVNEEIMFHFSRGRDSMVGGECDDLKSLVSGSIGPKLLIPHIQGIISSAIKINGDLSNNPEVLATAYVLSQDVISVLNAIGKGSFLKETFGSFSSVSTSPSVSDIVQNIGSALDDLGIPCDVIGNPSGYSLCSTSGGDSGLPNEDTPTDISEGLYVTTTYVQDYADIALDLDEMKKALGEGNTELARLIYRTGENSRKFDENGKLVSTRSFQLFSTKSTEKMLDEPEFNKFMYTLGNPTYADDLVQEALTNSKRSNPEVATEAVLVLNVWMEIVHLMHEALKNCKKKQLRDEDGVFLMDAAVAYWIGESQIAGDSEEGHLLYALSERFGEIFNIDNAGQSRTNTNILRLFNEAKNEVSLPNACSESQYTYTKLRGIVNRLIPQMAIPLIQGFILSLRENDRERVKIYSHAYVPLVAGCSPSLFQSLREKLFSEQEYSVVDVEPIIDLIRQSFDCLGLQCDDIGVHEAENSETVPKCIDPDINTHLAGYRPANDVRQYSRFDLDIREMDILLQMKAYSAVDELYTYGKHVRGSNGASVSIGQLATTKHRNIVPEFDKFIQYYNTDRFADDIIRGAIDSAKLDWTENWTDGQRRTVVIKATQVLVMYFAALQNAYEAVEDCNKQSVRSGSYTPSDSWDRAAALLIGGLEGTERNGTVEGYMPYDLAQEHCAEFGTCFDDTTNENAQLNEKLVSLLFTGRGAVLDGGSCRAIAKAADEISSLILIPIIQGALSNSLTLASSNDLQKRAEAYVYGRALVPFIRKRNAANDIDFYLGNPAPSDKRHTAQKVYAALATAYPNMNVDCEDIGNTNGIDTCEGVVYVKDYIWYVVGSLIGLILMGVGAIIFIRRRRQSATTPVISPRSDISSPPRGQVTHSMDLLEKAFTSRRSLTPDSSHSESDEETEALNRKYIDDRAEEMEGIDEVFDDEDHSYDDEVVALTKRGRAKKSPDII